MNTRFPDGFTEIHEGKVVGFRPKISASVETDCINRSAEYFCPNEATLEAVRGVSVIRCCTRDACRKAAALRAIRLEEGLERRRNEAND